MESKRIPVAVLCSHYNIEVSFITSLSEYGLLEIVTVEETPYIEEERIRDLEKLIQLHYDLDINLEGIDAIKHLLNRVENLQGELAALKNKLRLYENE
jgi:hypothetical protein